MPSADEDIHSAAKRTRYSGGTNAPASLVQDLRNKVDTDEAEDAIRSCLLWPVFESRNHLQTFIDEAAFTLLIVLLSHKDTRIAVAAGQVVRELLMEADNDKNETVALLANHLVAERMAHALVAFVGRTAGHEPFDPETDSRCIGISIMVALMDLCQDRLVNDPSWIAPWSKVVHDLLFQSKDLVKFMAADFLADFLMLDPDVLALFAQLDCIGRLLETLGGYLERDPQDDVEADFVANVASITCSLLANEACKRQYLDHGGMRMVLSALKSASFVRTVASRLLNFSLLDSFCQEAAEQFIGDGGLKVLFPVLSGRQESALSKQYEDYDAGEDREQLCSALALLFLNLERGSEDYERLVAKCLENDGRILELRSLAIPDKDGGNSSDTGIDGAKARQTCSPNALQQLDLVLMHLVVDRRARNSGRLSGADLWQEIHVSLAKQLENIPKDSRLAMRLNDILSSAKGADVDGH